MNQNTKHLMALAQIEGLGPISLQKLLDYFNDAEACFIASFSDFKKAGLEDKLIDKIIKQRNKLDAEKLFEQTKKEGLEVITYFEKDYPEILKNIYAPPLVLYYRGDLSVINYPSLAVVGSRKISSYAQNILPDLLKEAISHRIVITSGMAYGVDALAHRTTLENKGLTIAVIGSGLAWDYLYPSGHCRLAKQIIEAGGLILSEFPPFMKSLPYNFPRRNRIIAGLSQASLIVEASFKSGALITAKYALEQGREVLAIPGPINLENSQGVNLLIKNGAKVVASADDILESFGIISRPEKMIESFDTQQATADELAIIKILKGATLHIDKIIEHCTLDTSITSALLMRMELKGWIKNIGGHNYISLVKPPDH